MDKALTINITIQITYIKTFYQINSTSIGRQWQILPNFREEIIPILNIASGKQKRRKHFKLISRGQHYSDIKTETDSLHENKATADILQEHRCKNSHLKLGKVFLFVSVDFLSTIKYIYILRNVYRGQAITTLFCSILSH